MNLRKATRLVDDNKYLIKRLILSLIVSNITWTYVVLYYGVNFEWINWNLDSFLHEFAFLNYAAQHLVIGIFSLTLCLLPLIISSYYLGLNYKIKKHNIFLSEQERIAIQNNRFNAISYTLLILSAILIIIFLPAWPYHKRLTGMMTLILLILVFNFVTFGICCASNILNWLKHDNAAGSLPRTTMLMALITTIVGAVIGYLLR